MANPATDKVWVDIGEGSNGTVMIVVRDLLDRSITESVPIAARGPRKNVIYPRRLTKGTYILDLRLSTKPWSIQIANAH